MSLSADDREKKYLPWYRKYSDLHNQVTPLLARSSALKMYDFHLAFTGILQLIKGFHLQSTELLSESTEDLSLLERQLQKTFTFISELITDTQAEFEKLKGSPE